ncbi:serine protease [Henriciella sp.]|uniref:S1 family peptidase n=1 Tax=Henriciella sp. TaxID=1968823 RepID=UPI00262906C3|nr:serine protease [Henriciella sp.]
MAGTEKPLGFETWGSESKFSIQDPFGLREVIQPVVFFTSTDEHIVGLGTCFQVSPWCWLTAQHVVSEGSESCFTTGRVGAIGFSPGLVFGTVNLEAEDFFGPIRQVCGFKSTDAEAISVVPGPNGPDIIIDVASLRVDVDQLKLGRDRFVSPLPISAQCPAIGEKVLAIGYPILGTKFDERTARLIFEENLSGAEGVVTELHPDGRGLTRPWPAFEIEGDWASGMSGGPVINMSGQVVGVVSSSFAPTATATGVGYAVDLTRIPLRRIAPELDLSNPGWVFGGGAFKNDGLIGFYANVDVAILAKDKLGADEVSKVSYNPKTGDWIKI